MSKTQERITPENVGAISSSSEDKKKVKKAVEEPFVCKVCGRSFKSKSGLASHERAASRKEEVKEEVKEEAKEEAKEEIKEVEKESLEDKKAALKWVTQYIHGGVNNKPLIEQLAKELKVTLILPKEDSESKSAVMEAKINGQAFAYPKGVYIEVPRSMATLLKNSVEAEVKAGNQSLSNRSEEIRSVLS